MSLNPLKLLKGAAKIVGSAIGIDVEGALNALTESDDPEVVKALQEYELELRRLSLAELQTEIDAKVDLMKTEIMRKISMSDVLAQLAFTFSTR